MLDQREVNQLVSALSGFHMIKMNGDQYVNLKAVLQLLQPFCDPIAKFVVNENSIDYSFLIKER